MPSRLFCLDVLLSCLCVLRVLRNSTTFDVKQCCRELDEGEEDEPNWKAVGAGRQQAVKSLVWPGAVSVASTEGFTNYYCGFGIPRASQKQYVPKFPGNLSSEFDIGEVREASDVTVKPPEPEKEEEDDDAE